MGRQTSRKRVAANVNLHLSQCHQILQKPVPDYALALDSAGLALEMAQTKNLWRCAPVFDEKENAEILTKECSDAMERQGEMAPARRLELLTGEEHGYGVESTKNYRREGNQSESWMRLSIETYTLDMSDDAPDQGGPAPPNDGTDAPGSENLAGTQEPNPPVEPNAREDEIRRNQAAQIRESRLEHNEAWWGSEQPAPNPQHPDRVHLFSRNPTVSGAKAGDIIASYNAKITHNGTADPMGDHLRPKTPPEQRATKSRQDLIDDGVDVTPEMYRTIFQQATQNAGLIAALQEYLVSKRDVPIEHVNELLRWIDNIVMEWSKQMDHQVKLRKHKTAECETQKEQLRNEKKSVDEKNTKLEEKLSKIYNTLQSKEEYYRKTIAELKEQIDQLKEESSELKEESLKVDELEKELVKVYNTLHSKEDYYKKTIAELKEQIDQLKEESSELKEESLKVDELEKELEKIYKILQSKEEHCKKTIADLTKQIDKLKDEATKPKNDTDDHGKGTGKKQPRKPKGTGGTKSQATLSLETRTGEKDAYELKRTRQRLSETKEERDDYKTCCEIVYHEIKRTQSECTTIVKVVLDRQTESSDRQKESKTVQQDPRESRRLIKAFFDRLTLMEKNLLQSWPGVGSSVKKDRVQRDILTHMALNKNKVELREELMGCVKLNAELRQQMLKKEKLIDDLNTLAENEAAETRMIEDLVRERERLRKTLHAKPEEEPTEITEETAEVGDFVVGTKPASPSWSMEAPTFDWGDPNPKPTEPQLVEDVESEDSEKDISFESRKAEEAEVDRETDSDKPDEDTNEKPTAQTSVSKADEHLPNPADSSPMEFNTDDSTKPNEPSVDEEAVKASKDGEANPSKKEVQGLLFGTHQRFRYPRNVLSILPSAAATGNVTSDFIVSPVTGHGRWQGNNLTGPPKEAILRVKNEQLEAENKLLKKRDRERKRRSQAQPLLLTPRTARWSSVVNSLASPKKDASSLIAGFREQVQDEESSTKMSKEDFNNYVDLNHIVHYRVLLCHALKLGATEEVKNLWDTLQEWYKKIEKGGWSMDKDTTLEIDGFSDILGGFVSLWNDHDPKQAIQLSASGQEKLNRVSKPFRAQEALMLAGELDKRIRTFMAAQRKGDCTCRTLKVKVDCPVHRKKVDDLGETY
ncbi:hypothetical protein G7046_g2847 [Stylonectria norvegica]|nr:hypothetical protein G7046_g2847 [Stylonectria norvegica]